MWCECKLMAHIILSTYLMKRCREEAMGIVCHWDIAEAIDVDFSFAVPISIHHIGLRFSRSHIHKAIIIRSTNKVGIFQRTRVGIGLYR